MFGSAAAQMMNSPPMKVENVSTSLKNKKPKRAAKRISLKPTIEPTLASIYLKPITTKYMAKSMAIV